MESDQDGAGQHQLADEEAPRPSEKLLDAELQEAIDAAIASLPENQRLAIVLRRYEGMPYEEIAKVLKTSVASGEEHPLSRAVRPEGETQEISGVIGGLWAGAPFPTVPAIWAVFEKSASSPARRWRWLT